ncbi:MAG: hypothetical protein ACJAS4_001772 [Bacteriovoracaceae bacterium]|jgi:aminopeptidase YwaD
MARISTLLFILISILSFQVKAETLKEMVSFLASDKLEGRKPGKKGNEEATNYLVQKFQSLGLEGLNGSHKQEFTIFTEMVKSGDNEFSFGSSLSQFQPISYSLSGDIKNTDVVFAGFGISIPANDPNLTYDDYSGLDVKNKIVAVLTGDPGIGNKKSKFRNPDYINYRSLFYKLKNAISHGAKGILLVSDPLSNANYPEETTPFFNGSEGGGSRFSIISGKITNSFLNNFLPVGTNTLMLQKKIAASQVPFSFSLNKKANLSVHLKKTTGRVSNIVGVLKGSDSTFSKEVIVIGAHMDHLGHGGESSMDPTKEGEIHNGADDNASGTALVVQLAMKIKLLNPKRTYVFALFNAEEMGLLGSSHFVEMWQGRYLSTHGEIVAMLNYDMVGRYQKETSVMGTDSALNLGWKKLLTPITSSINLSLKKEALGSSDHASFINQKIPSLFFTTGAHEDYHTSNDTFEKLDYKAMKALSKYSMNLVKEMELNPKLAFNPTYTTGNGQGGSRGYGAHLGCVPEFGQSDQVIGVVCTSASENSPAEMAGIVAGDVLVQIGDIEVKSIYDLAFALKYYRAGDEIELGWKRGATLMKQVVTLARSRRH